jgi:hypothetical protein
MLATLIVENNDALCRPRQVGDVEADPRAKLAPDAPTTWAISWGRRRCQRRNILAFGFLDKHQKPSFVLRNLISGWASAFGHSGEATILLSESEGWVLIGEIPAREVSTN